MRSIINVPTYQAALFKAEYEDEIVGKLIRISLRLLTAPDLELPDLTWRLWLASAGAF